MFRTVRLALAILIVFAALFTARSPMAADPGARVYFGGIAFTGSLDVASRAMPHAYHALHKVGLQQVNQQLSERLHSQPPQHFSLEQSTLAALDGSTSTTVMATALDRETVVVEQIGDHYKVLFELAAQALFFDFRAQQVRFAYPITIQRIEVLDRPPHDDDLRSLALDIITGNGPATLSSGLAVALESMQLPEATARRLQLVEVSNSDGISQERPWIEQRAAAGLVGHEFSKIFSSELKLALLPYRSGHAIGNVMAARFADGRVYNLTVPEPDYVIRLELEDFRGRTLRKTTAFRQELLGAFFRVVVEEPISQTRYMDQSMRFGATKTIPTTQKTFDEDAAYYETLLAGLATFAAAVGGNADGWVSEQPERADMREQLKSLQQLVAQCR